MNPQPGTTFAAVFEQLRLARGISPASLARKLAVQSTQVSRWRHGQGVPSMQNIALIAEVFGVDPAMLERLAGYRASAQQVSPATLDPELLALVEQDRAELQEQLSGIPRVFWPAVLGAQRAARKGMMQGIYVVQSADASPAQTSQPAAEQTSHPRAKGRPSDDGDISGSGQELAPVLSAAA